MTQTIKNVTYLSGKSVFKRMEKVYSKNNALIFICFSIWPNIFLLWEFLGCRKLSPLEVKHTALSSASVHTQQ